MCYTECSANIESPRAATESVVESGAQAHPGSANTGDNAGADGLESSLLDAFFEPEVSEGEEASGECLFMSVMASINTAIATPGERLGGNRDLSRVLAQLVAASENMNRTENHGLTKLVKYVMDAHSHGQMGTLVQSLNQKAEVNV